MTAEIVPGCPRCFIENKPCARHCDPATCPDPAHVVTPGDGRTKDAAHPEG